MNFILVNDNLYTETIIYDIICLPGESKANTNWQEDLPGLAALKTISKPINILIQPAEQGKQPSSCALHADYNLRTKNNLKLKPDMDLQEHSSKKKSEMFLFCEE